jgi:hypothetical protein
MTAGGGIRIRIRRDITFTAILSHKVLQSCWNNLKASSCKLRFCFYFQHKYAAIFRAQYKVYSAQCTVHCTQNTVYSVQCTEHSAQYTVNSEQSTVHSAQSTAHSAQYTVHGTNCTVNLKSVTTHDRLTKS